MQLFIYSIGIRLYIFIIYLLSPFNSKAKKSLRGRKSFFKNKIPDNNNKFIWFHCASLGEFEQGRPLIEKIKKEYPSKKILLSFFSPSGYEIRKNYEFADEVIYLPFDTSKNVKRFFKFYQIEMAIFVKYDVWPLYLKQVLSKKTPVYLVSAVFRKNHFFFQWYGEFQKKLMCRINRIFVQDSGSKMIAEANGFNNVEIAGDLRLDRVVQIQQEVKPMELVERFVGENPCIVFGSVYRVDVPIIEEILKKSTIDTRIIIAPHLVSKSEVEYFCSKFPKAIQFANLDKYAQQQILIIDHIGSLNKLYQYATQVYVGGGFGLGIHNILEPAVYSIPVYFGPRYHKFPEAEMLIREELAFTAVKPLDIANRIILKQNEPKTHKFVEKSQKWFKAHSGATQLIFRHLNFCL